MNDTFDRSTKWSRNLDQEREYLEGLFNSRFNFYFVFSGIVAAGATALINSTFSVIVLLSLAGIISAFFWRALFRTYVLIDSILKITYTIDKHPLKCATEDVEIQEYWNLKQANYYLAQWIPGTITVAFLVIALIMFLASC